jgi:hypothetical protein
MAEDKDMDTLHGSRSQTPPPPLATETEKDTEKEPEATSVAQQDGDALEKTTSRIENYPAGIKLAMILLSIYLSVFLVALDRTIIATALPQITDKFQSFGDVGWVCL